jgi:hypothetical protein
VSNKEEKLTKSKSHNIRFNQDTKQKVIIIKFLSNRVCNLFLQTKKFIIIRYLNYLILLKIIKEIQIITGDNYIKMRFIYEIIVLITKYNPNS